MTERMWPIKSEIKSKRKLWGCDAYPTTWAWYKELRENNRTKKIYDVNPYVEVYQFRDNLYGLFAENLDGMGDEWMYLVIGPEKAMLIDTGYGLGDLKSLVDEITGGKPLIVVNTHDHFDHAYGNCRFDKVYCHEYNVPYLETQHAHMWDYIFDAIGQNIWIDFDRADLPVFKKYKIIGVPDGYTWNLGGDYEIELIFTGGHSAGHAMYLDKKSRILFSGDNLCTDSSSCGYIGTQPQRPFAEFMEMSFCRDRFQLLVDRIGEYDFVFPQHHVNNLESSVIANSLDTLNAILANPDGFDYLTETWGKDRTVKNVTYFKFIKGFSVMRYTYKKS